MSYNKKTVYVNLGIRAEGASWVIFDQDSEETSAVKCSSKEYALESHDTILVNQLRAFSKNYFAKANSYVSMFERRLKDRNESPLSDYDLILRVVEKKVLDDKVVLFVLDETDSCELHVYKYFDFVNVGDVIRVRSFRLYEG